MEVPSISMEANSSIPEPAKLEVKTISRVTFQNQRYSIKGDRVSAHKEPISNLKPLSIRKCFILEIENFSQKIKFEASWHHSLNMLVQYQRNRLNGNDQYSSTSPTNQEIASKISKYLKKGDR
ncbi:24608_t:CDS:2 [Entrophospora sp. SA101]|nr:9052_t:CDS:2 [Entrophospora sp. SA101]CAJ0761838.1 24608_t:CDS:2 [Entrophospora sp. SA101]